MFNHLANEHSIMETIDKVSCSLKVVINEDVEDYLNKMSKSHPHSTKKVRQVQKICSPCETGDLYSWIAFATKILDFEELKITISEITMVLTDDDGNALGDTVICGEGVTLEPDEIDPIIAAASAKNAMFVVQALTDNAPNEVESNIPLYLRHYLGANEDGSNSNTAPLEMSEEAEADKRAWREYLRAWYFPSSQYNEDRVAGSEQ